MIDNPGALVSSFEKSIQKETSINYKVHPAAPYKNYMENLSVCDLAIGTFPFGGSNTNVDLTLLGIPKIFYCDESDLASFADLNKLNKLNLPGILNATSESDVLANAIYLIHDHNERKRLSEYIKNQNAYDLFFNQGVSHEEHFFNKAINWIMENGK
jgi:predicted O-linked N-acetylglucosamine transferase (SPINDLY family)